MTCIRFTTEEPNRGLGIAIFLFLGLPVIVFFFCCCVGVLCCIYCSFQEGRHQGPQGGGFELPPAPMDPPVAGPYPEGHFSFQAHRARQLQGVQYGGQPMMYNAAPPPYQQLNQSPPSGSPSNQPAPVPPTAPPSSSTQPAL